MQVLGTCEIFEEKQVGGERFNIFSGCPSGRTATIVLRGGADQVYIIYWMLNENEKISTDMTFFEMLMAVHRRS